MRLILLCAFIVLVSVVQAQVFLPNDGFRNSYATNFGNSLQDTGIHRNWSLTRYSAISTGFMAFRGGYASYLAAPLGLQLNRRLTNNLYAFAGVSVEPAYINVNRGFISNDYNKRNLNSNFYKPGNLGVYSRAQLGLQYINDDRTFSISGSIGIERGSYPVLPFYQQNNQTANPAISSKR